MFPPALPVLVDRRGHSLQFFRSITETERMAAPAVRLLGYRKSRTMRFRLTVSSSGSERAAEREPTRNPEDCEPNRAQNRLNHPRKGAKKVREKPKKKIKKDLTHQSLQKEWMGTPQRDVPLVACAVAWEENCWSTPRCNNAQFVREQSDTRPN